MPRASSSRRTAGELVLLTAPAWAGLGAVLLAALWQRERAAAPATLWLGGVAAAVLFPLLLVARRERLPLALLSLLAPTAAIYLPRQGAVPLAVLASLLAAAVALVALERRPSASPAPLSVWLALAFAAQLVVGFGALWLGASVASLLVRFVVAPALGALALASLDRERRQPALAAAAVVVAAGPGFSGPILVALLAATLLASARPSLVALAPVVVAIPAFGHEPAWAAVALCGLAAAASLPTASGTWIARSARGALAFLSLFAMVAAAPPWLRARPIATILAVAASAPVATLDEPHAHQTSTLSQESPQATWPLSGAPLRALVVESFLGDGAALPCGTRVATVRLAAEGRVPIERSLTVGGATGEWASGRPDVAAVVACNELEPFSHWLPETGRFLGRSFRARLVIDEPFPADRVEIERAPELPSSVRIHLQRVASER